MDDLKIGAIQAARLYHTQYRELPYIPGVLECVSKISREVFELGA